MRVLGIDLGSREVKLVVMNGAEIELKKSWHTAFFYREFCRPSDMDQHLGLSLEALGVGDVDAAVSTGYGRNNTSLIGFTAINELKAHSLGAQFQNQQKAFVLLDVGGQDVKVMRINAGQLVDMNLNDKCAASCGRFLEQMAEVLDLSLESLTSHVDNPVPLSSTCAVFCESELIGKMAEGHSPEHLAAGVNQSLFKRMEPMLRGFEDETLWLSGGVAKSHALRTQLLGLYQRVEILEDPTYNGAIGCCQHAQKLLGGR